MEPSLPVKASLLVVMADYRIELVIKQVKKGIARDHLLAAWKPSLPVKASLLVVMADYRIELVIKLVKRDMLIQKVDQLTTDKPGLRDG